MKKVVALELLVILIVVLGATAFLVDYINPMTPDPDIVLRAFEHGRLLFAAVQASAVVVFTQFAEFSCQVDEARSSIAYPPHFVRKRNIQLTI